MAKGKSKVTVEVLSMEEDGFHIFVNGKLGKHKARFLIDTGASKTVIDKKFLSACFPELSMMQNERMGTSASGNELQSEIAQLSRFSIGHAVSKNFYVAVLDISHINSTYHSIQLPPIEGVIGCDFLVEHCAVINFQKKLLRFKSKKSG